MDIPIISRLYLTGAFLTTAACAVDIVSPFSLYFNWSLIFTQGEVWRLVTSYLFFGVFSIDFLFHMYFLVSQRREEKNDFLFLIMHFSTHFDLQCRISQIYYFRFISNKIQGTILSIIGRG